MSLLEPYLHVTSNILDIAHHPGVALYHYEQAKIRLKIEAPATFKGLVLGTK